MVNWLGVKEGAGTQSLFTTLKVIGIAMLCVLAFTLPTHYPPSANAITRAASEHPLLIGFVVAMIPILFAYDGWTDSTYVAGEVIEPRRNLPIAIVWGTWLVIAVYLLTNVAYFHVLGTGGVASYEAVGSETIHRLLGDWGARALAVLVAISTFGTINGAILTGPRVTQAMAADGLLWRPVARLDPRRGTPTLALWLQAAYSCIWLWCAKRLRGRVGLVRDHVVALLRPRDRGAVRSARAREARVVRAEIVSHAALPADPAGLHSRDRRDHRQRPHLDRATGLGGRGDRRTRVPGLLPVEGPREDDVSMSPESHAGAYFAAPEVYDLMYADMRFDIEPLIREAKTANGPVLEPCCGNGRITLPMAAAGVDCDGFDLDPGMVADLQRQAAERTLTIGAHVADMRDFTMPRRYGLIVIGFNSFLHNLTQEDQLRTLERCREHLLPGGRLHLVVFHPSARRLAAFDGTPGAGQGDPARRRIGHGARVRRDHAGHGGAGEPREAPGRDRRCHRRRGRHARPRVRRPLRLQARDGAAAPDRRLPALRGPSRRTRQRPHAGRSPPFARRRGHAGLDRVGGMMIGVACS